MAIVLALVQTSFSTAIIEPYVESRATFWQPHPPLKWQIILNNDGKGSLNLPGIDVYDVDLVDTSKQDIATLKKNGKKVICYFSAGSYENWRPDASLFNKADLGNGLAQGDTANAGYWPGEKWLNIRSSKVMDIMTARIQLAKDKGCDGVDPDNVDGYDTDTAPAKAGGFRPVTGFTLNQNDAITYMTKLAYATHTRGLAIGIKNAVDIVDKVGSFVEFAVNEQCVKYNECGRYQSFLNLKKPVFHVEYPSSDDLKAISKTTVKTCCAAGGLSLISSIVKGPSLFSIALFCDGTTTT